MDQQDLQARKDLLTAVQPIIDVNGHARITNPMDWRPIDRYILLALLVQLVPIIVGLFLGVSFYNSPESFNPVVAVGMLVMYAVHSAVLWYLTYKAYKKRQLESDWSFFESFIITSFTVNVLISSYLAGAYLNQGLLLLFLGVNITSALADIRKIRLAYWYVVPSLMLMTFVDAMSLVEYAPLFEVSMFEADGSPIPVWMLFNVVLAMILVGLIYICTSAVQRWVEREDLFRVMSKVDGLTQLTNRHSFIDQASKELTRGQRQADKSSSWLSCIMIDLDHFKTINDTWGHAAGDLVLKRASKIFRDGVRTYDEVGRYGGEEFCVLLPSTTAEGAAHIAERLREKLSESMVVYEGKKIRMTASFGVASFRYSELHKMDELLKAADEALYESKHAGRNRVTIAKPKAFELDQD